MGLLIGIFLLEVCATISVFYYVSMSAWVSLQDKYLQLWGAKTPVRITAKNAIPRDIWPSDLAFTNHTSNLNIVAQK